MNQDIINQHLEYLRSWDINLARKFEKQISNDFEAACAEAAAFRIAKKYYDDVKVNEDASFGGPDFIAHNRDGKVLIEVTSISIEAAETASGLPSNQTLRMGSYNPIVSIVFNKIRDKIPQLANSELPSILIVTTMHKYGYWLFDDHLARELMVGRRFININVERQLDEFVQGTSLRQSVFFKFENGEIVPCRQSATAVMLICLDEDKYKCIILAHPKPSKGINYLPNEKTYRIANWPIKESIEILVSNEEEDYWKVY